MYLEKQIRKIARSQYWQNLYKASKELSGIYLFNNTSNFSGLQVLFLYWLKIYSILYEEHAMKESDILDENVIKDDIRTDAYLYYRQKEQEKELYKRKIEELKHKGNQKSKIPTTPYKIFKGIKK